MSATQLPSSAAAAPVTITSIVSDLLRCGIELVSELIKAI